MKYKRTAKHIQEFLDYLKKDNPELEDVILYPADARCGRRVALARMKDGGVIDTLTEFMPHAEIHQFLQGYMFKTDGRLIKK